MAHKIQILRVVYNLVFSLFSGEHRTGTGHTGASSVTERTVPLQRPLEQGVELLLTSIISHTLMYLYHIQPDSEHWL